MRPEEIIGISQWSTIYSGSKKMSILNVVKCDFGNGDFCAELVSKKTQDFVRASGVIFEVINSLNVRYF
jgi:hypothetical protein